MSDYVLPDGKSLMLRTTDSNGKSYGGFQWPESGRVEAPDWDPKSECGNGLHGWLWGVGDYSLKHKSHDARWIVVEVDTATVVNLNGKIKVPHGTVVCCGNYSVAWTFMRSNTTAMNTESSATGNYGHASATGHYGHASATGNSGHASATGNSGHASATGDYGHASATGTYGHASATGDSGHASATGDYGCSISIGYRAVGMAGIDGFLAMAWNDGKRRRLAVGYVGEGIEACCAYMVDSLGNFVRVNQ